VKKSLRYAVGLIGAGAVLAALVLAITPLSLNGNSCQGSVVYVGHDSIMRFTVEPAPSGFDAFVDACMSARETRAKVSLGLAAAGVVLILGSAFVRPRPKIRLSEPSPTTQDRA
jgi:hypothetical protein